MRLFLLMVTFILILVYPVTAYGYEYTAPPLEGAGEKYMPDDTESFVEGLWSILIKAAKYLRPSFAQASKICIGLIGGAMLFSMMSRFAQLSKQIYRVSGTAFVSLALLSASTSLISLASQTVSDMSNYAKLLVPVLTGSLAAQGGTTSSAALYTGTAVFDSILSSWISSVCVPLVYIYLVLSIANNATNEKALDKIRTFIKWLLTWSLKLSLYVFTGYIGITKVVSGATDAAALKATKITISGMVPVIGGILSDASEAVLVGAGIMKNAAGVYGLLAIASILVEPFLMIGIHYLLLKCTCGICAILDDGTISSLIKDFTTAMSFLLAMTGTVSLMLLVSVVCFMKGVS